MARTLRAIFACFFYLTAQAQPSAPVVSLSHLPVCTGDTAQLQAMIHNIVPLNCGASNTPPNDSIHQVIVGTGTATNSNTVYPAPYGNWYKNARHRFLYTASDLNQAGFSGGKLSGIAFYVTSLGGSTQIYKNYRIRVKCTSDTQVPSNFSDTTGYVEVYYPKNYTVFTGWNQHDFDVNFNWDGVSNLIFDICFDNLADPTYTYNCSSPYTVKTFPASLWDNNDITPLCPDNSSSFPSTSYNLPNIRLTYGGADFDPTRYSFSYSPSGLLNDTTHLPLALPGGPVTYTVTVLDHANNQTGTGTLTISYSTSFTISFASTDSLFCPNEQATYLSASPPGGIWSGNGIQQDGYFNPSLSGSGVYPVTYAAGTGTTCFTSQTVNLEVGPPQDPTITTGTPLTLCKSAQPINIGVLTGGGVWQGNGMVPGTSDFNPATTFLGPRQIIYSFSNYCYVADTIVIDVLESPVFVINQIPQYCPAEPPVVLSYTNAGGPIYQLSWSGTGITDTANGIFTPAAANIGPNMIILTANLTTNNCSYSDTAFVNVYTPNVYITATDTTILQGGSAFLTVYGANTYLWNNGLTVGSMGVAPDTTTTYTVIGTLTNGCVDTASITIIVIPNSGMGENFNSHKLFSLNPNRTSGNAVLKIEGAMSGLYRIALTDALGRTLQYAELNKGESMLIGNGLVPGMYFVRIQSPVGGYGVERFLKE